MNTFYLQKLAIQPNALNVYVLASDTVDANEPCLEPLAASAQLANERASPFLKPLVNCCELNL